MATNERALPQLDCSNLINEWPNWKRNFMVYMIANGKWNEPEPIKIANFIWLIGTNAANIYNTLFPNDGTQNALLGTSGSDNAVMQRTLEEVLQKFDNHCLPLRNIPMESYKFNSMVQKERQPFVEFEMELRTQVRHCDYICECGKAFDERMVRDRIIVGVHDKKLQLKLLDGRDEELARVIETCKTYEAANMNKDILDAKQLLINTVKAEEDMQSMSINEITRYCFNCGLPWKFDHNNECKAKNVICHSCSKKGHFKRMCRKVNNKTAGWKQSERKQNNNTDKKQHVAELQWSDLQGNSEKQIRNVNSLYSAGKILRLNSIGANNYRWTKNYLINKEVITFKLDTGADINCIPLYIIKKLKIKLENQNNCFHVVDYNNNRVEILGTTKLKCEDLKSKISRTAEFVVVNNKCEPVLGLITCEKFGLIKLLDVSSIELIETKESFIDRYKDVFHGLGTFPGKVSINLKENSKPVLHYKKRIPNSLLDKLKLQLKTMVQDEIISPVDYPTDWVNNIQIVEKPNSDELRICLDPKPLNECIRREHFLIPTIEDLTSRLTNKRVFSVLDLKNGYWQMRLDKGSSDLTTFMTPFGRFKFNRVPFGLNFVPEMFQREMVKMFGDIGGVIIYFDDVAICAESEEEHDQIMAKVMNRAQKNNIKFNPKKIQYRQREVKFMGNYLSEGKIKPDLKYQEAILKMKKPENKSDILRFLGLLKYLAKFIPNLSKQSAELRNLTRNDVEFKWTEKHDLEFENLLSCITNQPVLAIYDPQLPVIIQTDASKDGLGCVIIQEGHPIAFASRTLTKSEQKWAQIEKELLAIVFACQRFHFYLYGREFTVESDHKPLETLIKRDIDDVTMRLQRMFMLLLKYPKMTVVYKPGKDMLVADCLSRAQLSENAEIEELSRVIHSVTKSVCCSEANYNYYRKILESDEKYWRIYRYVENGWPGFHQIDNLSQHFYKLKSELHAENGLLFLNHRLVIPTELQKKISIWLHLPHLGIEKTLARARMLYYWPEMNSQIKEMVALCRICEKFKRNNQKEPLNQEQSPKYPFQMVAMDLFEYAGLDYIVIIDAYSNYLMAQKVQSKTSKHIIDVICQIFDKLGYPTAIKCDNSPFGSLEFERFSKEYNIQFKYSSPRYPQSNGLAEKGVAIAKNILKRCYEANDTNNFQYRLLEYNTTPLASMNHTPSELFFGRLVKTKLPLAEELLITKQFNEGEIQNKFKKKKERQKKYYDRNAKLLPALNVGDPVMFRKSGKDWYFGTIIKRYNDRSYIIQDSFNNQFRRNRRFIAKTQNNDFNASDLLYEESGRDNGEERNNVESSTAELGGNVSGGMSSSECEVSGESEPAAESQNDEIIGEPEMQRTRSGRISKPPQRYGW